MKNGIALRIKCEECKTKHDIPNKTYDDYNIYFRLGECAKNGMPIPHLLCPECTNKYTERGNNGKV